MAAPGPMRRVLLCGSIGGALAFAATPSSALIGASPAPAATVGTLLYENDRGGAEALLHDIHLGRFCRWHRGHRLCYQLVQVLRFCDRRPDHRLCDDNDDDNRFCKKRPDHPLCDDDRFCKKRPDHPLCDDDQPPSPS